MKSQKCKLVLTGLAVLALLAGGVPALATVNVTVDPGSAWIGYMNVFTLPIGSGTYEFGSAWGNRRPSRHIRRQCPDVGTQHQHLQCRGPLLG